MRTTAALVGILVASATLAAAPAEAARHSGVAVRVARDGPCAVPGPRCDNLGVPATIRVERARSRRAVRTVHTDTGKVRIRLRPGRYRLLATADSGNGTCSALVAVKRHRVTSVVVRLHRQPQSRA